MCKMGLFRFGRQKRHKHKESKPVATEHPKRERFGLFTLANPEDEGKSSVDIVAVHGLGGDWEATWSDDRNQRLWLRDFLPSDLPMARIMSYGYDSDTFFSNSVTDMDDVAIALLESLDGERWSGTHKAMPIIFISHSLGGIIVKKALILAHERSTQYGHLLGCVQGLIFFGVPHRGADLAYWATFVANLLKVLQLGRRTNTTFVEALQRSSKVFADTSRQFVDRGAKVQIAAFYETERLLGQLVVDKDSAVLNLPNERIAPVLGADHRTICKFDDARSKKYSMVSRAIQRLVESVLAVPVTLPQELSRRVSPTAPRACFMVPFERDRKFVGREYVLDEIRSQLSQQSRVAIAGMGGVGKSQIAIEYCYRFQEQNRGGHVFWIHASSVPRMDEGYRSIAQALSLPGRDDVDVDTYRLVSNALTDCAAPWLLVLDNADDIDTVRQVPLVHLLPRSPRGSALITTRDIHVGKSVADNKRVITVSPMTVQESESLLRRNLSAESSLENSITGYHELAEALGYLPLAITQAAAYIDYNAVTVKDYLDMFRNAPDMEDLLQNEKPDFRRDSESGNSVIQSWQVSFKHIRSRWKRAADLLCLMAFLDEYEVPSSLLKKPVETQAAFLEALGKLQAFSLVSTDKTGVTLQIHRLVQVSTRIWLALEDDSEKWQGEALAVLAAMFPSGEYINWGTCQVLYPHAQVVIRYNSNAELVRANLLTNMATYEEARGQYNLASKSISEAISIRENALALGREHKDTLMSKFILGRVSWRMGKYKDAETIQREVREQRQKVLGLEHPDTLSTMNELALSLAGQGNYKAAVEIGQQTLKLREKVLGPEHRDTLTSMHNIIIALMGQENHEAAEKMSRLTLQLRQKALGPKDPDTLRSMINLSISLISQEELEAAETMCQRTVELCKEVLGPEHPDTLKSMHNLALCFLRQEEPEKAESIGRETVELCERVLGPERPLTIMAMHNLSISLSGQMKYEAALEMGQKSLELCEKELGPIHPHTLLSMKSLSDLLMDLGEDERAQELVRRRVQRMRESDFDPDLTIVL